MKGFISQNSVHYPTVLVETPEGGLHELLNKSDLAACKGDPQNLLNQLREKGLLSQTQNSVL